MTRPLAARVVVGACGASINKTVEPPWRARENRQTAFQAEKPYNRAYGGTSPGGGSLLFAQLLSPKHLKAKSR